MITYKMTHREDVSLLSEIIHRATQDPVYPMVDINHPVSGWMAFVDGTPAGCVIAYREVGELYVVAVVPEYRRMGIAR